MALLYHLNKVLLREFISEKSHTLLGEKKTGLEDLMLKFNSVLSGLRDLY